MDCIVLAGGLGTRVSSITQDLIPKIMIEVNGKPFLEHLVYKLYHLGVRRMALAAGFKADVLEEYLHTRGYYSWIYPWMDISLIQEKEPLDTGGAILNAMNTSAGPHSTPFLVINGDSLILPNGEDNYEELYYEMTWKPECAIFTCKKEHDGRYGNLVRPDVGGWVEGFENNVPGVGWINCGWYIFRREFFKRYKDPIDSDNITGDYKVKKMSLEKDIFPERLIEGHSFAPIIIDKDQFVEIGTPEALEVATKKLKEF